MIFVFLSLLPGTLRGYPPHPSSSGSDVQDSRIQAKIIYKSKFYSRYNQLKQGFSAVRHDNSQGIYQCIKTWFSYGINCLCL